ncbi:FIG00031715: Predicted metal-dependent phosphoesterases (PHP family) [hydrothermal vent metagenome]|uniref:FIG00031715: Predicted metal-dependent phosphoesterases (PHP family) n=1 Tax=hydrothermal vent metagenome TaxID=652676 RepID=A0A3B0VLX6_9ZZZZ
MYKIDLHCHSVFSDGLLSPTQLITRAERRGLNLLALTDHDTMAGIPEAEDAADNCGLKFIAGLELSANHNGIDIHILGYGMRPVDDNLRSGLERIQTARERRNEAILKKLRALGHELQITDLPVQNHGQLGRPHIAHLLTTRKIATSENDAFRRFLRKGAAAYVKRDILTAEKAVTMIRGAGGLAFMAHPGLAGLSEAVLTRLLTELMDFGLSGVEVYHPSNSPKNIRFLLDFCERRNLLISGGSDFHGRERDRADLGEYGGGRLIPSSGLKDFLFMLQSPE